MFESRLRLVFVVLILLMAGLAARAFQLQVKHHAAWAEQVANRGLEPRLVEPPRGRILDVRGRELAVDKACIDACVDYEAILAQPSDQWIRAKAMARLKGALGDAYRSATAAQQLQMRQDQIAQVRSDLKSMWAALGQTEISGSTPEQVEQKRQQIVQRVEMLERYLQYSAYVAAVKEFQARATSSWYLRWLDDDAPQLDQFKVTVSEQHEPHVILPAISPELANHLGKNLDHMPGLVLRPGQNRDYPYGSAASHVIGYLNRVPAGDKPDPTDPDDKLKRYLPNDLIGKGGVEALGEPLLRGQRGRSVRRVSDDTIVETKDAIPGEDVRLTIDIELQKRIEDRFAHPLTSDEKPDPNPMYGGAVVIDVPTGQIRALVSYPTYDLNTFDQIYAKLVKDDINRPLMNRATQFAMVPGSTIKPLVGIAALAEGVVSPFEGIECTGYLVLNGRRYLDGKCWTAARSSSPAHHTVPWAAPHHGTHGNADGFLTFAEALERSCNIYFETAADRLGTDRLSPWLRHFGLGKPVGIGLAEAAGCLPDEYQGPAALRRQTNWSAGIGQGHVNATPLQMASAAATIARDGLWIRPTLTSSAVTIDVSGPDRAQIPAKASFFALAKEGMTAVVNNPAGTGHVLQRNKGGIIVAGKTGTAQAGQFSTPRRDAAGKLVRVDGRVQRDFLEPSTSTRVNPAAPWYRGSGKDDKELDHAWFIGFAPAENPQIAFAVFVEYGGSGGQVAGSIAREILDAAIDAGYLGPQNH